MLTFHFINTRQRQKSESKFPPLKYYSSSPSLDCNPALDQTTSIWFKLTWYIALRYRIEMHWCNEMKSGVAHLRERGREWAWVPGVRIASCNWDREKWGVKGWTLSRKCVRFGGGLDLSADGRSSQVKVKRLLWQQKQTNRKNSTDP